MAVVGEVGKSVLIFMLMAATLLLNGDDNLVARLGLEQGMMVVVCVSLLGAMLLNRQSMIVVSVVVLFSLNANMPADFALNMGLDRDLFAGLMKFPVWRILESIVSPNTGKSIFTSLPDVTFLM